MAKEKRTKWLNKISRWILDALPSGRSASGQKPQELASQQTPTRARPKPTSTESSAPPRLEAPAPQWLEPQQPDPSRPEETIAPQAPRAALAESSVKTINQAWKAFELAWTAADLSDHYFLEGEELHQTLAVLDRSFEEELIEWLFQLCTKPDALKDLAGIIERGQVKPTDNIDAIRAFAYVSVAVSSRPRQPPAAPPLVEEQAKPQPDAIRALTPSPNFVPELSPDGLNEEATAGVGNIPLEVLELSIRSFNCLERAGIHTLLDLAGKTEESLLKIKNFGQKSVDEVLDAVERRGLTIPFRREDVLGTDDPGDSKTTQGSDSTQTEEDELRTLGLSARALNGLYRGKIYFISQLIAQSESDLLAIQNLGPTVIAEIKAALQHRGLALVAERDTWPEEAATLLVSQQALQDLEEAWQQLRQQVDQEIDQPNPAIETLLEFCASTTTDPARRHLSEILGRLKSSLDFIADTLTEHYSAQSSAIKYSIEAVQTRIASQLLQHTSEGATQRVHRITKSFSLDQERNWLVYLLRCNSQSLTSIGSEQEPALSRDQVRLMETKISNVVGIKPADIVEQAKQLLMEQESKVEKQVLEGWLARLDRLPTQADQREEDIEQSQLLDQVCEMDLKNRSALLSKHQLPITGKEYDYHYQYVVQQISAVGTGYWREFENLKQFVLRHAIALGEPELMPKQTSFPRAVGGIVTSHGGQGKVAKRIGLKYQGQLVGSDGGRRYWTDDRLIQLLADINNHYQIDIDVMPSYGEVLEFFAATEMGEYQDKKPHSAVAAFTKMGTLHWSEVAQRFDKRFISGESQKNVTLSYIKAFVRDIGEHLNSLTPSELFVLFQAQGINRADKEKFSRTFDALVDAVQSGMVNKEDLRSWADNNQVESVEQLLELGAELKGESSVADKEQKLLEHRSKQLMDEFPEPGGVMQVSAADLPTLEPANVLRALDKAGELIDNSATDGDKVEFLKAKATAKLWDACFQDEQRLIDKLRAFPAEQDSYSEEVQQAFLDEYAGARALPIPTVYAFKDLKGIARDPKLMQRLVAFRLQRDLRLLNLSGTGTGKTLSAIYSAQICDCQRILISCPNGVIESWRRAFESAFPTANLIIRPEGWSMDDIREGVNVVIVNHERFQDRFAQQLLGFCVSYQADMIVVDEIHQSKRRSADTSSQRRKLMNEYIRISSNINPGLRVLGLSATPVINNLYEGRSLLELICQESFDDVEDKVDLNSCMNLYQHFIVHGIRMNPGQLPRTTLIHHEVDATALLPEIVRSTKRGNYHDIEQLLVQPKLECLSACLERDEKTIIFITYIKNTLTPITRWLSANSFSYSVFTGDEKDAQEEGFKDSLEEFIHGSTQVLVASVQCAGTGVDGLQSVCSRAIFFQLPWTSTEFEQAVGRLDRDGTNFDSVVVHIPITDISLPDGQRWSWCRSKLDRLESKRDIAKAAVDGEIPDAATLISPGEASKYWTNWLEKLDRQSAEVSIQSTQP